MLGSASQIAPLTTDESRREERTHLFVAATLYFADGSCPVHIRNMSPTGALIEGAVLPEIQMPAIMKRGELETNVSLVWKAGRKAGLSFSSTVHVAAWMGRAAPTHQGQVDEVIRRIRAGSSLLAPARNQDDVAGLGPEAELEALSRELAELEEALIADPAIIETHPEIQLLDTARQRVGRIITALGRS